MVSSIGSKISFYFHDRTKAHRASLRLNRSRTASLLALLGRFGGVQGGSVLSTVESNIQSAQDPLSSPDRLMRLRNSIC